MNNPQNTSVNSGQSSNISSMFGQELHDLGDKIERIAEKLKSSGKTAEGDELYQIGDQVEHFFDKIKNASFDSNAGSSSGIGASSNAGYGADTAKNGNGMKDLLNPIKNEDGKLGYLVAWLLGVPSSVLLLIFLIRGH